MKQGGGGRQLMPQVTLSEHINRARLWYGQKGQLTQSLHHPMPAPGSKLSPLWLEIDLSHAPLNIKAPCSGIICALCSTVIWALLKTIRNYYLGTLYRTVIWAI